ncbi:MAG: DUF790 family protein [Planctomycetota bacterium]
MLRSEHALKRLDFDRNEVHPDRLLRQTHGHYRRAAVSCIARYAHGRGSTREDLHHEVEAILRRLGDCPPRRIAAFCKLLDDASEFETASGRAASLRRRVFEFAAELHPVVSQVDGLFQHDIESARQKVMDHVGMTWGEIEQQFFADVIELQRLSDFDTALTAEQLLARYNVAQTQAALYRATRVELHVHVVSGQPSPLKHVVRAIKLSGLMHRITQFKQDPASYHVVLDGPAAVLRGSTRYGVRFAKLLAMLLASKGWRLRARIQLPKGQPMTLHVSDGDGLRGESLPAAEMDSEWERDFAACWDKAPVEGWHLHRESQIFVEGQQVFTPDFELRHARDQKSIHIELVGFWTPEYLSKKAATLERFGDKAPRWLIFLPKSPTPEQRSAMNGVNLPILTFDKRQAPSRWIAAALRGEVT